MVRVKYAVLKWCGSGMVWLGLIGLCQFRLEDVEVVWLGFARLGLELG